MLSLINTFFVFVLVWSLVLFTVLPVGVRRIENPEAGHSGGAPANPELCRRFFITTLISVVVTTILVLLHNSGFFYNLVDE